MNHDGIVYTRSQIRAWLTGDVHDIPPEELLDLDRAVRLLPHLENTVVILVWRGYSLREISNGLGLGKSATPAKRILDRALKRMEEVLNGTDRARAARPAQER